MFVEFKIISGSVGWMRAENTSYTDGRMRLSESGWGDFLGDFGAEFSKTKTLGAGVRIFNGAVRAEREFPLKILFLACIQGFVVLLILRNGDQNLPSRSPNTISVYSVSKYFRIFFSPVPQINSNFMPSHCNDGFLPASYLSLSSGGSGCFFHFHPVSL